MKTRTNFSLSIFNKGLSVLILICMGSIAFAQINFNAKISSSKVGINQQFNVTYSLSGGKSEGFERPPFEGFRLLGQSTTSGGGSVQMYVNGQLVNSNEGEYTWSFTLMPTRTGSFTIKPAKVKVNGEWIQSPSLPVTVMKAHQNPSPTQAGSQQQPQQGQNNQGTTTRQPEQGGIKQNDVIVQGVNNKQSAWVGEPIIITYKIYTRVTIPSYAINKIPAFDGFWSENLVDPNSRPQQSEETINGQRYSSALLRKIIVYPQRSGQLTIEPLEVEAIVRVVRQRPQQNVFDQMDQMMKNIFNNPFGDPFAAMGNMGASFEDIQTTLKSNTIKLDIKDLPTKNRPANFAGQVGQYTMEAWFDNSKILLNDALNFVITISGNGNMSLLEAPSVEFPASFDVYDPQTEDKTVTNATGISGEKIFTYLIIPRESGKFKIPPVSFSYFDPRLSDYVQLSSDEFSVEVIGTGGTNQNTNTAGKNDIQFIKLQSSSFRAINQFFMGSLLHWLIIAFLLVTFSFLLIFLRRRIRLYSDIQALRYKKALGVARKRMKKASILLQKNELNAFYEETSRAIWEYLSDRFAIQKSELSIDKVISQLSNSMSEFEVLNDLKNTLEFCEFIRFSPGATSTSPGKILDQSKSIILQLEQQIQEAKSKNNIKHKHGIQMTIFIGMLLITNITFAQKNEFDQAGQKYRDGEFFESIELYEKIISTGYSNFETYFNLGNAYVKTNNLAEAVYCYEKALQLRPYDEDALHNLEYVHQSLKLNELNVPEAFYIRFPEATMKLFSPDIWAVLSIIFTILMLTCILFFLLQIKMSIKKLLLLTSFFLLLLTSFSMWMGYRSLNSIQNSDQAIIMNATAGIKSSPDQSSADIYSAQAGIKVKILSSLENWYEIRLPDGSKGWVQADAIKKL